MGTLGRTTRNGKKGLKPRSKSPPAGAGAKSVMRAMAEAEAVEQNKAITDILRVISNSPADLQPVFDTILSHAIRLCEGDAAVLWQYDGSLLHFATSRRADKAGTDAASDYFRKNPLPLGKYNPTPQAALERRTVHVADVFSNPKYRPLVPKDSFRTLPNAGTVLAVPLLRQEELFGVISIWRFEKRLFTAKQIAMVETFAAQATIAIHNVRLFTETKEALERQTATADILRVISGSPTDVQPVLRAVAESAARLCNAADVHIRLVEGDLMPSIVHIGAIPLPARTRKQPISAKSIAGRAILERRTIHIDDVMHPRVREEYPDALFLQHLGDFRSLLVVPMVRDGAAIGTIAVRRAQVRPFSQQQIKLLETFAAQAVIAIENVRLFNETRESLERQTAMSEILRVISSSPADLQPVFDTIVRNFTALCGTVFGSVFTYDGELVHYAAGGAGFTPEQQREHRAKYPVRVDDPSVISARTIFTKAPVHVHDTLSDPNYDPERAATLGVRRILGVPMLRDDVPLGAIVASWAEPGATPKHHEALLKTFADQAAIAIENVRLFNETKEALEQQKASADVLGVISSSIADTKPVFDKILESCQRLFAGRNVGINVVGEDGRIHIGAYHGFNRGELEAHVPVPLSMESGSGAAIVQRHVVHYPDCDAPGVPDYARRGGRIAGNKSVLFAPMLWEGKGIGAIFVGRPVAGPFSEKEIALLKTFADQAAIAIQNARLFREIQEKSAQLEVANKHKSDFLANMSHELRTPLNAIIGFSEALMDRMFGEVNEKQADYLKDIHESGRHLLSLINDILDLSKIEAGRMELDVSTFHLPSALSNAMTLIRERAQRHGIELGLDVDQRLGEFQADERKFKQIMLNLLSNAVKFTPDGGRVDVCAKKDTDKIEIAVKDTGIGIAPEDQAAVFEEFKQVGRDQMRKAEGTGLGLALTRRFVELHGGAIRLESTPGKGSTFTVSLPLRAT